MASVKITITGIPEKEPKKQEKGVVSLVFLAQQSAGVPKGLEPLADCPCLVHVAPQQWEQVQEKSQPESQLVISGEVKSSVNKKGIPYLEVVALDIGFAEKQEPQGEAQAHAAPPSRHATPSREQPRMKLTPVEGTVKFVELDSIALPEGWTAPSAEEVQEAARFIRRHKRFEKPLVLEKKSHVLLEGDAWYLAAKELSLARVPIAYPKPAPPAKKASAEPVEALSAPPLVFEVPVPKGTQGLLEVAQIKIPEQLTPPHPEALKEVMAYVEAHQTLDKPLWVKKESHLLLDGYKRYLAAKELNIERVPITYTKPPETGKPQKGYSPAGTQGPWYKAEEVFEVQVNEILLTEPIHYEAKDISLPKKLKFYVEHPEEKLPPVVVRKHEGKYSLVTGMRGYFAAKILGVEQVPAVLTDLSHDEFMQAHGWVERGNMPVRGKK